MTNPNTESFEDVVKQSIRDVLLKSAQFSNASYREPDLGAWRMQMEQILAAHQATIDQRVAEAERLGRARERYEILRYIESLGASELLTEIVNGIGKRGPTGDLGADYVPTQLKKGEKS